VGKVAVGAAVAILSEEKLAKRVLARTS